MSQFAPVVAIAVICSNFEEPSEPKRFLYSIFLNIKSLNDLWTRCLSEKLYFPKIRKLNNGFFKKQFAGYITLDAPSLAGKVLKNALIRINAKVHLKLVADSNKKKRGISVFGKNFVIFVKSLLARQFLLLFFIYIVSTYIKGFCF